MKGLFSFRFLQFVLMSFGIVFYNVTSVTADGDEAKSSHAMPTPTESHSNHETKAQDQAPKAKPVSSLCLSTESVLEEIKKARAENERRQKELDARDADLKSREIATVEELKKLTVIRDSIGRTLEVQSKEKLEKVAKLVEAVLAMAPKAASRLISTLDDDLAVSVIFQIDSQRLAKIMGLMETKRASHLFELLTGVTRVKNGSSQTIPISASNDVAGTENISMKGGEKRNGRNENSTNANNESQQISRKPGSSGAEEAKKGN